MDAVDIVSALLPSLIMFFAVSLGANSLERYVQNYARGRFEIDRIAGEVDKARTRIGEIRVDYDRLIEEKAELDMKLAEKQAQHGDMTAREVEFSDQRHMMVYEIGIPRPQQTGWYVKLIGPEMHEMFSGPASGVCPFPGRRAARLIVWGIDNEDQVRLRTKKVFGALSEIMVIRPFSGKLRLGDV